MADPFSLEGAQDHIAEEPKDIDEDGFTDEAVFNYEEENNLIENNNEPSTEATTMIEDVEATNTPEPF